MEGDQPLPIVSCILILLANLLVNIAYIGTFRWQIDDYRFNEYIKYHRVAWKFIMILCVGVSMHIFRLTYTILLI